MKKKEVPVYLVQGFLDAGKTTFIKDLLTSPEFCAGERTLFLRCEDGEEEYDEASMRPFNVTMVPLEAEADFCLGRMEELVKNTDPQQVVIEYNGMWPLSLCDGAFPDNWVLYQIVCLIEAKTFDSYSKNLGQLMMEKLINADVIVFNRCTPELKDYLRSRNLKIVNRQADIYLEDENGEGEDYFFGDEAPFDMDLPLLELNANDYGVWYVNAMDFPKRYEGKTVKFKGIVVQNDQFPKGCCAIGRFAMVCCAEDLQFLGMVAKGKGFDLCETGKWAELTAKVEVCYQEAFQAEGPLLKIESLIPCDTPADEVIGF